MAVATLFTLPKARAIAPQLLVEYYKLDVKISNTDDPAYVKNFPLKKVPTLIAANGYKLHEVIAVLFYLVDLIKEPNHDGLLGTKKEDLPQVLKWMSFVNSELLPTLTAAFGPLRGDVPYNKKQVEQNVAKADQLVAVFESRLEHFTYLVGERITVADILVAAQVSRGFQYLWGKKWIEAHPAFVRWYKTILASKVVRDSEFAKNFKFIEKPLEYVPPKKEKKAEKKAAPAAKKEEKPKAAEQPAEKKPKHPLELLGKPAIALDEWKRTYSNEDTREKALPYFWNTFYNDKDWSLWKVDFKYNDELTLTFMSNNQVGGFFNRLTASSKYIFGSMVVYGENNNNGITGAFLVRGHDYVPAFNVAPDWESYSFTKLDPTNASDKAFINNSWAWDEPVIVNGEKREIADGKVCK